MDLSYIYQIYAFIKSFIYGLIMNSNSPCSTYNSYYMILKDLKDGSTLLDIGVGDGVYFNNPKVAELITTKNLKIKCIDIDRNAVEICQERIQKAGLSDFVTAETVNLLDIKDRYDYVLFMDCYPVIDLNLIDKLVKHSRTLSENILMYHNLFREKNDLVAFIKPRLKYFTLNDFGRLTTIDEMEHIILSWGFDSFEINEKIECCFGDITPLFRYIPVLNKMKIYQYLVCLNNKV